MSKLPLVVLHNAEYNTGSVIQEAEVMYPISDVKNNEPVTVCGEGWFNQFRVIPPQIEPLVGRVSSCVVDTFNGYLYYYEYGKSEITVWAYNLEETPLVIQVGMRTMFAKRKCLHIFTEPVNNIREISRSLDWYNKIGLLYYVSGRLIHCIRFPYVDETLQLSDTFGVYFLTPTFKPTEGSIRPFLSSMDRIPIK